MPAQLRHRKDSTAAVLMIIPGIFLLVMLAGLHQLRSRSPELRPLVDVDVRRSSLASGGIPGSATTSRFEPQQIRVVLHEGLLSSATVECTAPYIIHDFVSGRPLAHGQLLRAATIEAMPTGLRVGPHLLDTSAIRILPQGNALLGFDNHFYRGSMTVHRTGSEQGLKLKPTFSLVNHVPLETYVATVVDSEMPATFPQEARCAQAIVARTYAIARHKTALPSALFDVFASTRSQKYLGAEYINREGRRLKGETAAGMAAAQSTAGMVVTYEGQIITSYYSAVCGGRTLDGQTMSQRTAPCLKSVVCEGCRNAPLYRWQASISGQDLLQKLSDSRKSAEPSTMSSANLATLMTIRMRQDSKGSLPTFTLTDGRNFQQLSSIELRRMLGTRELPSPQFSLKLTNDQIEIEGQGSGHCVGFCQWGARGLAQTGLTAQGIVQHYYPGADVVKYQAQPLHFAEAPHVTSGTSGKATR